MIYISILFIVIYLYYLALFFIRLKPNVAMSYKKRTVSIVVAARNEEKNIINLLTRLVNQSYPSELCEIIIADDGSSDNTKVLVEQFSQSFSHVRIVEVINREQVDSPKKNALEQAIKSSRYEIILSTDADCLPGKHWVQSMVENFGEDVDMVTGFSRTNVNWKTASLVQKFEHFDFLLLFFAAAGALSAGKAFSCSGQNIAYRKAAFEKVNGFGQIRHLLSGDDVNLMQLFRKAGFNVHFSFSPASFMMTHPVSSWRSLFNQRVRWASNTKWQITLNPEFFIYLLAVLGTVILPFILLFFQVKIAIFLIGLRLICELIYIRKAGKIFEINTKWYSFYPLWFVIQPFYMIVAAIAGQLEWYRWK